MTIRLGMVGCGRISHAHGIAAQRIGGDIVQFVACSDVKGESAREFAEAYGCDRHFTSSEEMYRQSEIDAVVLATWPAQHLEQITEAINADVKYILCEKALATSSVDAIEIWRRAKAAGVTVVEGFMYLHHPAIKKLEEAIREGNVGRIDWVRSCSSFLFPETAQGDDPNRSWRFRKDTGGGVPWDLACYTVNACARYIGELPKSVIATGTRSSKYGTINRMFGTISYENEKTGVIESSACAMFNQELEIHGETRIFRIDTVFTPPGDAWVDELHAPKFAHVNYSRHEVPSPLPLQDDLPSFTSYRHQLEAFLSEVRGAESPLPPLSHSAVNVSVIEALIASMDDGERKTIDLPEDLRADWASDFRPI